MHFPYVTLCSWEFLNPGMQPSWFSGAESYLYDDWANTYGDYKKNELEVKFVNASELYGRNGYCLQVDAHKYAMKHERVCTALDHPFKLLVANIDHPEALLAPVTTTYIHSLHRKHQLH